MLAIKPPPSKKPARINAVQSCLAEINRQDKEFCRCCFNDMKSRGMSDQGANHAVQMMLRERKDKRHRAVLDGSFMKGGNQ